MKKPADSGGVRTEEKPNVLYSSDGARCPLCGSGCADLWYETGTHIILRCGQCRMIWVDVSQVSDRTITSQYLSGETSSPDYYVSTAPFDRLTFSERLKILDRFAKPGGLLDVGSSVGTFLEAATDRGWQAEGIEPNPMACALASRKGLGVTTGFFDDVFAAHHAGRYDAVHLGDVIEHVRDPHAMLARVRVVLKPAGVLIIVTPNIASVVARWFQVKPREHILYFDRQTCQFLLQRAAFSILHLEQTSRHRSIGQMDSNPSIGSATRLVSKLLRIGGLTNLVSWGLRRWAFDELLVIARPDLRIEI